MMEVTLSQINKLYADEYITSSDYKELLILKPDSKLTFEEAIEKEKNYFARFRCTTTKSKIRFEIVVLEKEIKDLIAKKALVFSEDSDPLSYLDEIQIKAFLYEHDNKDDENAESLIRDIINVAAMFELRTGFFSMNKKEYDEIINNALIKQRLKEEYPEYGRNYKDDSFNGIKR